MDLGYDEGDILNSIDDALIVIDDEMHLRFANLRAFELFGMTRKHSLGQPLGNTAIPLAQNAELMSLFGAVAQHDVTVDGYDIKEPFPVIGERTLRIRARRLRRSGMRIKHTLVMIRDVTPRVRAFEKSEEDADRSQARIAETNHRLKNNLTSILSMLRLERQAVREVAAQDVLDRIAIRVEAIAKLYELLAIDDDTTTIDLLTYLQKVCGSIEKVAGGIDCNWSITVDGDTIKLDVSDAVTIASIVHELATNAAKYAFSDKDGPGLIEVESKNHVGELIICVRDNGVGLGAHDRAEPSTNLGMRLVEGHAANLSANIIKESAPGGGTSVTVRIPRPSSGQAPAHTMVGDPRQTSQETSVIDFRQRTER